MQHDVAGLGNADQLVATLRQAIIGLQRDTELTARILAVGDFLQYF